MPPLVDSPTAVIIDVAIVMPDPGELFGRHVLGEPTSSGARGGGRSGEGAPLLSLVFNGAGGGPRGQTDVVPRDVVPGDLMALMGARRGHFVMESGYHGDLRLDLDGFFADPSTLETFVGELARRVARFDPDLVCGPLTGGAFIAYDLACRLGTAFRWTERENEPSGSGLFPYRYRLAGDAPLRGGANGRRRRRHQCRLRDRRDRAPAA